MQASILIVDDSATERTRISGLLSRTGQYDIRTASDGAVALTAIAETPCDLVLTDLNMPTMDGLKLLRKLREKHPHIPAILMTASGSEAVAVEAMKAGASSYLNKSSGADWLHENVERVLAARFRELSNARLFERLVTDEYKVVLPNDRRLMSSTARFLRQLVQSVGLCSPSEIPRVGVALEEALLNACLHGNLELDSKLREGDGQAFDDLARERSAKAPWKDRRVRVTAFVNREQMKVDITDEGPGFNPDELPDPTDPENLLKPHGRGVLMMRMFMDEVQFNDRGNRVTLTKNQTTE